MIAAIYARKSNDQTGVADEAKSVTRQIEHARAYAERKGWRVSQEHIYVDDGVSGAEFARRPGLMRLLTALKPTPSFTVLIMSEEARVGREQIETVYLLKQIITAGVRVFDYLDDRELRLESPTDKLLLSVTAFAAELEREKARQRTHDALVRKARAGHVPGGAVYGYDNVPVSAPDAAAGAKRLHVERRINEAQAAIVREIFELAAAGKGARRIAHDLNARGVPAPPPRRAGRPQAWSPSAIYAMLTRPLYRGEIVWNRTRKRNVWGQKQESGRPEEQWVRVPAPHLRIVPEALWQAVQARLKTARDSYLRATGGQLWGRPANGIESKYLLTEMAQCGWCGGSLIVRSRASGARRVFAYICSYHHLRGRTVCQNGLVLPMDPTNETVLRVIEQQVLSPEVVHGTVRKVLERLRPAENTLVPQHTAARAELAVIEQELSRLSQAVAQGGDLPALLDAIRGRERRRQGLQDDLAALERFRQLGTVDLARLERDARERLSDFQGLLTRQVRHTRQLLKQLLVGRIIFRPTEGPTYEFVGQASFGGLLAGVVCPKAGVAPTGFEPVFRP